MVDELENPYENIIKELDQCLGKKTTIKVEFPKKEKGCYNGILVMIRDEYCILLNQEKKERISIPYCIISRIT